MKMRSSVLCIIVALVVLAGMSAQAGTVIVRPVGPILPNEIYYDNAYTGDTKGFEQPCTNGWSINTYNQGWGQLCPWGPSTYENHSITQNVSSGAPFPNGGKGSYYATCDYFRGTYLADINPSNSWLGTDQWQGQPVAGKRLGDITEMNYYSFTSKVPQRFGGLTGIDKGESEWWSKNGWWNTWQQPILLEFTAEALNPITNEVERRQFWYRADGANYVGDDGMKMKGYWIKWNCMTWGKWYSPQYDSSARGNEFGITSWAELMAKSPSTVDELIGAEYASTVPFKDWTLSPSSSPAGGIWKSSGWKGGSGNTPPGNPNATGTGKPINFRVGARCQKPMTMYVNGKVTEPTLYTTTLTAQIEIGAIQVPCASTSTFSATGTASIDNDDFAYTSKTATLLKGCTGLDAQHLSGATVVQTITRGANTMWPNESYGFRGQVDLFTLGFGKNASGNPISETYDFEPKTTDKPVSVVGTNIKSLGVKTPDQFLTLAPIVQGAYPVHAVGTPDIHNVFESVYLTEMTQKQFLCKVFGKVTRIKQGPYDNGFRQWQNSYFLIEDGSNLAYKDTSVTPNPILPASVWVFLPPYQDQLRVYVGDYVSVYGYVEPLRWKGVGTPLIMWSQQEHVTEMNML